MKRKKGKKMQKSISCTDCKHNSGLACRNPPDEKASKDWPKVFNCDNYEYVPFYVYYGKTYYAKFHNEAQK